NALRLAMRCFGENIGMAFQIRDDILDYIGTSSIIGKPLGGDIKEKKITLPLIYALKQADKKEASDIIKLIKHPSDKNIRTIMQFVNKYKGIEYAAETAMKYSVIAKEQLQLFPESESRTSLNALVDFIIERKN
ncbi:MAG: polyprenyl synthetase family protein, partial [Methanococcaceae archaeon]